MSLSPETLLDLKQLVEMGGIPSLASLRDLLATVDQADRFRVQRDELVESVEALLSWATGSYAKDPKYWTAVRLSEYEDLLAVVAKVQGRVLQD